MKHLSIRYLAALLTFIIGIAVMSIWFILSFGSEVN
jgi:hypothetical protein